MDLTGYKKELFDIDDEQSFEALSMEAFLYQYHACEVYKEFCNLVKHTPHEVKSADDIPFLPIQFFKSKTVTDGRVPEKKFASSGTTGQTTSKHFVHDLELYQQSALRGFHHFYGDPSKYIFLALLPGYTERDDASLVYMVNTLMEHSNYPLNGYFLDQFDRLNQAIEQAVQSDRKLFLIGVTHAMLQFARQSPRLPNQAVVMETGGMKGKGKELTRYELHNALTKAFEVPHIHSEYGMTELLSQAYAKQDGIYETPPWMKVVTRSVQDPFGNTTSGRINVIDLANIHSCCFIATDDLGVIHQHNQFEVIGRMDHSELRGCNLMLN